MVGIQFPGINFYPNLPNGPSKRHYRSYTRKPFQGVGNAVFHNFIQAFVAFVGGYAINQHRKHAATKFKYRWCFGTGGQIPLGNFQHIADIVCGFVQIGSPFKLALHNGKIVNGGGSDFIQAVNGT